MNSKEEYRARFDAQMKQWEAQMAQWRATADKAGTEARLACEREIEVLKRKQVEAREMFDRWGEHGGGAWQDMKAGAQKAWDELGLAYEKAAARFKKTDGPGV